MSTLTSNYELIVVEGSDLVNPLEQWNPNMTRLDTVIKGVANNTIEAAVETVTGTVHSISFLNTAAETFKFIAISDYVSGDTFVINGVQMSAFTTDGTPLTNGCYKAGKTVIGSLSGNNVVTFFVTSGNATAENSLRLDGHERSYFATNDAVVLAQNTATNRGIIANEALTKANALTDYAVYSTNEKVVGTWINNKPLYRRTFHINSATGQYWLNIATLDANVRVINGEAAYTIGNVRYIGGEYPEKMRVSGNALQISRGDSSRTFSDIDVTIYYNKTTD